MKSLKTKEAKLVELKAQGKTHKVAYRAAYNVAPQTKDNTATSNTQNILNKPKVKLAYEQALARNNITLDRALTPIDKGLSAKRVASIEGDFYVTEVDDLSTQLQASDRALKLLGVSSEGTGTLHLHLHQQRERYKL